MPNDVKKRGLYVHVPFCRSKCGYCDFASYAGRESDIDAYLDALEKESSLYRDLKGTFDTAYIGGGTPSILSPMQIERLCGIIGRLADISDIKEFTFEANPESVSEEKAHALKNCGINRISMGLQSHKPELLKRIGRITSPDKFLATWEILKKNGFSNMNGDLMTGLPGQTLEDFKESMRFLTDLCPSHISIYPLEIHPDTPLGRKGTEECPNAAADMYDEAIRYLAEKGYERYEISNFAQPGKESLHNMHYWLQEEYLGLGPAAASYIKGERRTTISSLDRWMKFLSEGKMPECSSKETLFGKKKHAEKIILGLRLSKGIEIDRNIFIEFKEELQSETAKAFLETEGNRIRLKPDRFYMADRLFIEFL